MENPYKDRSPIHPRCKGCDRIVMHVETRYCSAYVKPAIWWKRGGCPLGSHVIREDNVIKGKVRAGQQKQKKKTKKK